jgi:hypothetical protein
MRILLVSLLLGCGLVGCGDDTSSSSGNDMSIGSSTDMLVHDLSTAACGDLGPKHFGDSCTTDCDCDTSMCRQFSMGATHLCTKPCTVATQATDCPAPSTGMCTPNLYCKF